MAIEPKHYNIASISQLLRDAFTANDLRRFCRDRALFRPILDYFTSTMSLMEMTDVLLEQCENRVLLDELLAAVEEVNPRQYARHCQRVLNPTNAPVPLEFNPDLQKLRHDYLTHIRRTYQHLDFRGIPQVQQVATQLSLRQVYVGLLARTWLPEGDTWARVDGRIQPTNNLEMPLLEESIHPDAVPFLDQGDDTALVRLRERAEIAGPVAIERFLVDYQGLVVLGEPGAGKTTLLKILALLCAEEEAEMRLGIPGNPLPVLIPLAAYAAALREHECCLADYLADYYHQVRGLSGMAPLFANVLAQGDAMVLLDGLDEVLDRRAFLVDRVEDFFRRYAPLGNRLVVTSRIVGYRDAPFYAQGLVTVTLVDFEREQIKRFSHNWCHAFEIAIHGDTPEAHRTAEVEKEELLGAVFSNPGVERLASNPLLLTILALIKRQDVSLPRRRVELYELYLKTLVSAWNKARALDRRPVGPDLDYLETMRVLAPLALWVRETSPDAGLVSETILQRWLADYYQGDEWGLRPSEARQRARDFFNAVHHYSSLLVERGKAAYGFSHLTFEEYLAAQGVAQRGELDLNRAIDVLRMHLDDPAWHETVLLTIGYLGVVQRNRLSASAMLEHLLATECEEKDRVRGVLVAGEALQDIGTLSVTSQCRDRVLEAMVNVMQNPSTRPDYRRRSGLLLGWLGWLPEDLESWISITAGPFLYGSEKKRSVIAQPFRISKYPVCNAQFSRFVEAGGYNERTFWTELGWAWRNDELRVSEHWRDSVKKRSLEQRDRPMWWPDPEVANPLMPVVGVSWFEAEAYCEWLTIELRRAGSLGQIEAAHLPTQEEWERASRGTDGRAYPWGINFSVANANLSLGPHSTGGTTAVCTYPAGASPSGIWDASGNAREWTRSWYWKGETRVIRGSSWADRHSMLARCITKTFGLATNCSDDLGFRVVLSS